MNENDVMDGQNDNDVRDDISWLIVFSTLVDLDLRWGF